MRERVDGEKEGGFGAVGVDGSIVEDNELCEGGLRFEVGEQMISYVDVLRRMFSRSGQTCILRGPPKIFVMSLG